MASVQKQSREDNNLSTDASAGDGVQNWFFRLLPGVFWFSSGHQDQGDRPASGGAAQEQLSIKLLISTLLDADESR